MELRVGSFIYTQNEKGEWVYKSDDVIKVPFKKDGTLKQSFKDFPRYKAIVQYENVIKKEYEETLANISNNISKYLKDSI